MPYDVPCQKQAELEPAAVLEALLFLSGEPLAVADIKAHTGWTEEQIEEAVQELSGALQDQRRGLSVIRVAGGYQMVTKPVLHDTIKWVRTGVAQMTPMALEVLSIIAFKQPVTRADIEKIRGVSSERIVNTLLQQGLIVDLGRKDSPGRPILYGTSPYFLECLGVDSLDELAGQIPAAEETDDQLEELNGTITKGDQ